MRFHRCLTNAKHNAVQDGSIVEPRLVRCAAQKRDAADRGVLGDRQRNACMNRRVNRHRYFAVAVLIERADALAKGVAFVACDAEIHQASDLAIASDDDFPSDCSASARPISLMPPVSEEINLLPWANVVSREPSELKRAIQNW
jgi:hypothetical protein